MSLSDNKLGITTQLKPFIKQCELDLVMIETERTSSKRSYSLFHDYDIYQVCECCDNYGVNFAKYGYAKYPIESAKKILKLKPDIEVIPINEDEYFINISCLDNLETLTDDKELYSLLMDLNNIEAHNS
ncbi:hypothetical protein Q5O24_13200 [Eubacteriaceae bacterium ES3]|nr:hypothetical protein Q5O24_13200 [Eubacteriaceae bacterium ES3]